MTQVNQPKVVKKKLFSPIWILPILALAMGTWLGIKSIRESGINVRIHFPNATGIEVGKTLVRYQGLTVGKVVDLSIDDEMQGVNVDLLMDYRATPFLKTHTKFWLVKPKASITGIKGLDTLFSGNYIATQPGEGDYKDNFTAELQAPPVVPGADGLIIELTSNTLRSLDVDSQIYYHQIPVGKILGYHLINDNKILFNVYIQKKYAHLVKQNSLFWNVSGLSLDASLAGVKIKTESLSAILAGGISFSSDPKGKEASTNQSFTLYDNQKSALDGIHFSLTAKDANSIKTGTSIVFRGVQIGRIIKTHLSKDSVRFDAVIDSSYSDLLRGSAKFWTSGAQISLSGVKNVDRLFSGSVINFSPGIGAVKSQYQLLSSAPSLQHKQVLKLTLATKENPDIKAGAEVRFKQLPIGKVTKVHFNSNFSAVNYQVEIWPEYRTLIPRGSYFVAEPALAIHASLKGLKVNTRDFATLTKGAISLVQGHSSKLVKDSSKLTLFKSNDQALAYFKHRRQKLITLTSVDGANLKAGSPVYFKKMQIGEVRNISFHHAHDNFAITIAIDKEFTKLIRSNTVFWRNSAVTMNANLSGIKLDIAPLAGAINGSIGLGLLDDHKTGNPKYLYASHSLAIALAKPIKLQFPASTKLAAQVPIRYLGHQIGEVQKVVLDHKLDTISVDAYLYGDYAAAFTRKDSRYFLVDAKISLLGITAAETLVTGPYIAAIPGSSAISAQQFVGVLEAPVIHAHNALQLTLVNNNLGSIKVGTPIIFRGLKIGKVQHYRLANDGTQVLMQVQIDAKYRNLVNQTSQFWDLSGIKVDLGLFSGAKIETQSVETVIAGGIGVATEKTTRASNQIKAQQHFVLHKKLNPKWLKWKPGQSKVH